MIKTQLESSRQEPNLAGTAFGCPRDFNNRNFVYTVVSPRARGLSIGLNLSPDRRCNFDCPYCEVDRDMLCGNPLDVRLMALELEEVLEQVQTRGIRERPCYHHLPERLLDLRHVALSGDGEPTLSPDFLEVVQTVVQLRALGRFPFFKLVLITNASGLASHQVKDGLGLFVSADEIWAKLDGGTQSYLEKLNGPECCLETVMANILETSRRRAVIIQSLFPSINGDPPPAFEIEAYVGRLQDLKANGAQISLVQIYSATRPTKHSVCGHLPLQTLSHIAKRVREATGLKAEVF